MEHAGGQMIIIGALCEGFGNIGVAKITRAVENKIPLGVVRFDNHPGYENESGDIRWL